MRQFVKTLLVAAGVTVAAAAPAHAQANLTFAGTTSSTSTVNFHFFNVTTAGEFDLFSTSALGTSGVTPFDPVIALFRGNAATGTLVDIDDDSCPNSQCGSSIAWSNSLINDVFLGVGSYTLAITDYPFTEGIFRNGTNPWASRFGGYNLRVVSSADLGHEALGRAVAVGVPEPASAALVLSGLLGLAAAARRRRNG